MINPQDLEWLVERRSRIQSLLLRLHNLLDNCSEQNESSKLLVLHLLIGAGFSLWRSVFLVDYGRTLEKTNEHAKEFLRLLIKDNMISYAQDDRTRTWTSGYYINNAYFRLHLAQERLSITNTSLAKSVTSFLNEQRIAADVYESTKTWDNAHDAAMEILEKLFNDG